VNEEIHNNKQHNIIICTVYIFCVYSLLGCTFQDCGKIGEEVIPLIVNGQEAKYGVWPWQAGLFILQGGNWTFWCAGSLVNEYAVLTG
jgi:secreted trypsin-like serine protease